MRVEHDDFGDSEYDDENDSVRSLNPGKRSRRVHLDSEHSYGSRMSQQTQIMNDEARK